MRNRNMENIDINDSFRKDKVVIAKTLFRKILFGIVVLTIFSIPLFLSTYLKVLKRKKQNQK
jgi:hypothetical protein